MCVSVFNVKYLALITEADNVHRIKADLSVQELQSLVSGDFRPPTPVVKKLQCCTLTLVIPLSQTHSESLLCHCAATPDISCA